MQPGKMDRRISLLRRSLARNEHGEQVETFTEYATVWAEKRDVNGREYFTAQQVVAENTARFFIRYRSDVLLTDRISCGGRTYNLTHVAEIGRKDGLEIIASARVE
jgi:SPP1 family predicted phage head-tail adaptor